MHWKQYYDLAQKEDFRGIARCISIIENEQEGYDELLKQLPTTPIAPIIGITGPPGAGKSTLTDKLIGQFVAEGKKVAVLCVDPSSPFNLGALLGDRIRMSDWYTHPNVFIRSLASRGALGGLHPHIVEIADFLSTLFFDLVMVETVGVGQSEIEITGLADVTVVVLVPEAGDEIQTMKAGLMEIADVFVVNKADRPDAISFAKNLQSLSHSSGKETPVVTTIATEQKGIAELAMTILQAHQQKSKEKKPILLAEKAWKLIERSRMKDLSKNKLVEEIQEQMNRNAFNLYSFIDKYIKRHE
jgi:LAO/AO transport system kinase